MGLYGLTLRQRLYVLTLLALAPAIVLLLYNEVALRETRTAEVHRSALRLGEQASLEMQRIIDGAEAVLLTVGRAPSVRSFNAELCIPYLRDIQSQMPQFTSFAVIDGKGILRCRPDMPSTELSLANRTYFKEVMKTGQFFVGTYQKSAITGRPLVPFVMPIKDDGGVTIGMVVAGLNLDWLDALIKARGFGPNKALTLADRDGVIIARHPFPEKFVGTKIPDAFMPLVNASEPGTKEVLSQDGTRRIIGYVPVSNAPRGIYVSAGLPSKEALQPVVNATRRGILIIFFGSVLAFIFATWTGKKLIREPLTNIVATVDQWRAGKNDARTHMAGAGEIAEVGAVMNAFMDELEVIRAERRQADERRAVMNQELEHRVKNILAMVQAIASQTFRSTDTAPQMATFSARLAAIGEAFSQLRQGAWLLADLASIVRAAIAPYRAEQFEIRGVQLDINPRAALSFSMALHELATNAAKYGALSHRDGRVIIAWEIENDQFKMRWREHDGPPVVPPLKTGFGTRMIQKMLASDIGGTVAMTYHADGLECTIEAPLVGVVEVPGAGEGGNGSLATPDENESLPSPQRATTGSDVTADAVGD